MTLNILYSCKSCLQEFWIGVEYTPYSKHYALDYDCVIYQDGSEVDYNILYCECGSEVDHYFIHEQADSIFEAQL
jgi:hypothetical protein